ncbi:lantibiotic dehydratase C-terminal domain-containing protein [Bacillus sp. FSL M8-0473]|uniref:lantibiotic dehydratase C-terminal domain-containing protein n=1 Tax=Bacillus sp. FSL M8-0473 TaxID=2978208 RepID=UPI0030F627C3
MIKNQLAKLASLEEGTESTCVRENNHIIHLEYNPEYKRYGGENGIEIAERTFLPFKYNVFEVNTRN